MPPPDGSADLHEFPVEAAIAREYGERSLHALYEIARIAELGARFAARGRDWFDSDPQDAPRLACEALIIKIGENAARVGESFVRDHSQVPWRAIKTMRNRLTHYYDATDYDLVWNTITRDFPQLQDWADDLLGRR